MTDRPIIFSGPMVRAILDGRKTQTRRVLTRLRRFGNIHELGLSDTVGYDWHFRGRAARWHDLRHHDLLTYLPYAVGDRLWVREHCATWIGSYRDVVYRADETEAGWDALRHDVRVGAWNIKPSIFMPRWASRLTLIVEDVRLQRLRDITCADAIAEGISPAANSQTIDCETPDPRASFRDLWDSLNAKRGYEWGRNPWVVALTFRALMENIDRLDGAS